MAELWPGLGGPNISYISSPPSETWRRTWPRSVVILGSTGSIGRSALDVIERHAGRFEVAGLSCAGNVERLAEQAVRFRPPCLAVLKAEAARKLRELLPPGYAPRILEGSAGYAELASLPEAGTVLSAQSGGAGLAGTLAAALAGKVICLANKESLVLAGDLVREICRRTRAVILPVDSEHNAIFQCLAGRGQEAEHLLLTASGGPFFGQGREALASVTAGQAIRHPIWRMGTKISIDSATLMNKGLEIAEAFHLYGVPPSRIRVLVHPQSVVHSLVEFEDGALLAQMGAPDMRAALANCLLWPLNKPSGAPGLDLVRTGQLTFHEADPEAFPALDLARRALSGRGGLSVVMNAANEAAVELFLRGAVGFLDIPRLIGAVMEAHAAAHPDAVGKSLTPALAAADMCELKNEVSVLELRIMRLDRHSRDAVCRLAEGDGGK
ncbi:MAG: 1-deoxy-D-xylulose-5-phosphate reductoisomerase [Desulfovibrio sp.]|jgi:1-deoxy-D-xylulose-5-phosphate reductoisomerase|nr:1-deoxy-D-xylulose-5-phosphate reductoisomerase [Desulfovibrio sp.]